MIKIGLVGEDPNDTTAIKALLQKKYSKRVEFHPLIKNVKGWQLNNVKAQRSMAFSFKDSKCKFVLYVRDLDALKSANEKIKEKEQWFKTLDKKANGKGILLLNIWELEALILSDIKTFNRIFKTDINFKGDPMMQREPKEFLKRKSSGARRKYEESDCPEIFQQLNFETVRNNCKYFNEFITQFESKLSKK